MIWSYRPYSYACEKDNYRESLLHVRAINNTENTPKKVTNEMNPVCGRLALLIHLITITEGPRQSELIREFCLKLGSDFKNN